MYYFEVRRSESRLNKFTRCRPVSAHGGLGGVAGGEPNLKNPRVQEPGKQIS